MKKTIVAVVAGVALVAGVAINSIPRKQPCHFTRGGVVVDLGDVTAEACVAAAGVPPSMLNRRPAKAQFVGAPVP